MAATRFGLMLLLLCTVYDGTHGQSYEVEAPVDTAGHIGKQARMNCTIDLDRDPVDYLEWYTTSTGGTGDRIFISSTPGNVMEGYAIEEGPGGKYDLIFLEVTKEQEGLYECKTVLTQDVKEDAQFIAITEQQCSNTANNQDMLEGQFVTLSCELNWYGTKPVLEWFLDSSILPSWEEEQDPEDPDLDLSKLVIMTNITASAGVDRKDFDCRMRFADVPPTLTEECSTSFTVTYAPTNIAVYPDPDESGGMLTLSVGSEVNCSADGQPTPLFDWWSQDGNDIREGHILVITEDLVLPDTQVWRCRARNSISGVERTSNMNVSIFVTDTDGEAITAGVESWVIAVAVVVPLVALAVIGVVGFMCYKRRNSTPSEKKPSEKAGHPVGPGDPSINTAPAPYSGSKGPSYNPQGGVPVLPPGTTTDQHMNRGRDSPGYGDLGIRHFGGSNPGLDDSVDLDPNPTYAQPRKGSGISGNAGQQNHTYQPTPPENRAPYGGGMGGGSVV